MLKVSKYSWALKPEDYPPGQVFDLSNLAGHITKYVGNVGLILQFTYSIHHYGRNFQSLSKNYETFCPSESVNSGLGTYKFYQRQQIKK